MFWLFSLANFQSDYQQMNLPRTQSASLMALQVTVAVAALTLGLWKWTSLSSENTLKRQSRQRDGVI